MKNDKKNFKELVKGMAVYTSASILGPILLFGGTGWFIDKQCGTKPLWMLIFIGIAFVVTNILLFSKVKKMIGMMEKIGKEAEEKKEEKSTQGKSS
ncbi:MAG: AtpZ/AtpI family protein [Candidatus Moranbacteria bacterium]|nr:AtpZ/AtpI family protein [Candidatus Moranbacteria bacterium]